jgi:hypothetical protein
MRSAPLLLVRHVRQTNCSNGVAKPSSSARVLAGLEICDRLREQRTGRGFAQAPLRIQFAHEHPDQDRNGNTVPVA